MLDMGHAPLTGTRPPTPSPSLSVVTSQDFIKFWGKFFAFVLLMLIENPQGFKTF
jgi:hypothetical protein